MGEYPMKKLLTAVTAAAVIVSVPSPVLAKKKAEGKTNKEAFRCLKRHLVRVVFRAMQTPRATAVE